MSFALAFAFSLALTVIAVVALVAIIVVGTGAAAIPAIVSACAPIVVATSTLAAPTATAAIPTATAVVPLSAFVPVATFVPSPTIPQERGQQELNPEITRRIARPRFDALIAGGSAQGDLRRRATDLVGLGIFRRQLRPAGRIHEREDDGRARHRPAGAVERLDDEGMLDGSARRSGLPVARHHFELR
jgi:hypothetical protein